MIGSAKAIHGGPSALQPQAGDVQAVHRSDFVGKIRVGLYVAPLAGSENSNQHHWARSPVAHAFYSVGRDLKPQTATQHCFTPELWKANAARSAITPSSANIAASPARRPNRQPPDTAGPAISARGASAPKTCIRALVSGSLVYASCRSRPFALKFFKLSLPAK
jgi:hypothetical protein